MNDTPYPTSAPISHLLEGDDRFPNSRLPLLTYPPGESIPSAADFEKLFARNHWNGSWRNGVYPYHHYHSEAHEVLGCYAGSAVIRLGGEGGIEARVEAGWVVVIPAGVAHKRISSSPDFAVVGAYPEGQRPDMCYGEPDERPAADDRIARVPLPASDPVFGEGGPLVERWRE